MKKLVSIVLAATILFTLGIPAFAVSDYSATPENIVESVAAPDAAAPDGVFDSISSVFKAIGNFFSGIVEFFSGIGDFFSSLFGGGKSTTPQPPELPTIAEPTSYTYLDIFPRVYYTGSSNKAIHYYAPESLLLTTFGTPSDIISTQNEKGTYKMYIYNSNPADLMIFGVFCATESGKEDIRATFTNMATVCANPEKLVNNINTLVNQGSWVTGFYTNSKKVAIIDCGYLESSYRTAEYQKKDLTKDQRNYGCTGYYSVDFMQTKFDDPWLAFMSKGNVDNNIGLSLEDGYEKDSVCVKIWYKDTTASTTAYAARSYFTVFQPNNYGFTAGPKDQFAIGVSSSLFTTPEFTGFNNEDITKLENAIAGGLIGAGNDSVKSTNSSADIAEGVIYNLFYTFDSGYVFDGVLWKDIEY